MGARENMEGVSELLRYFRDSKASVHSWRSVREKFYATASCFDEEGGLEVLTIPVDKIGSSSGHEQGISNFNPTVFQMIRYLASGVFDHKSGVVFRVREGHGNYHNNDFTFKPDSGGYAFFGNVYTGGRECASN